MLRGPGESVERDNQTLANHVDIGDLAREGLVTPSPNRGASAAVGLKLDNLHLVLGRASEMAEPIGYDVIAVGHPASLRNWRKRSQSIESTR